MTRRLCGAGIGLAVGLASVTAHAWKPATHVYLAQQAVEDLLDDGELTIEELDPNATDPAKRIKGVLGKFSASPAILKAIRENPGAYYSGVVGPDGLPDIGTGQCVIHPPSGKDPKTNRGGPGTDYWWQRSWNGLQEPGYGSDFNRAFVIGMYGHGAGDAFAHTFVNAHVGGIWDMTSNGGENAIRHLVLEAYLGERTPELAPHRFAPFGGTSVYKLVHEHGMNEGLARFNRDILDAYQLRKHAGEERTKSIPWYFGSLKERLKVTRDRYKRQRAKIHDRYETAKAQLAKAKKRKRAAKRQGAGLLAAEAEVVAAQLTVTTIQAELKVAKAINSLVIPYLNDWMSNIDEGLLAWPKTNHRVMQALMLRDPNDPQRKACPPRTIDAVCEVGAANWKPSKTNLCKSGLELASEELHDFWWAYGTRMVGAPDKAAEVAGAVRDLVKDFRQVIDKYLAEAIDPFREFVFDLKVQGAQFANAMIKKTYGLDMCKWADRWTRPSGYIDDLFKTKALTSTGDKFQVIANDTRSPNALATSVKDLNHTMGLKSTTATDSERFKWREFAPAFNTVQLIKMSFLPQSEIDRVLALLGSKEHLSARPARDIKEIKGDLNVMLGWHGGLDAGNQWAFGTHLVFARECSVFTRLFMRHANPHTNMPYEPNNPCETSNTAIYAGPRPKSSHGFGFSAGKNIELEAGTTHTFELSGDFKTFTVTAASEPGAPTGAVGPKTAHGFSFTAPTWQDDLQPIFVSAVDDDNDHAGILVRVTQPLAIKPAIDTVTVGDKVAFDLSVDRPASWRVTKGSGHFGEPSKIASLQKAIADKRAAKASTTALEAELDAEMQTYYAPATASEGERVEVEVTMPATATEPARRLTETFEIVAVDPGT